MSGKNTYDFPNIMQLHVMADGAASTIMCTGYKEIFAQYGDDRNIGNGNKTTNSIDYYEGKCAIGASIYRNDYYAQGAELRISSKYKNGSFCILNFHNTVKFDGEYILQSMTKSGSKTDNISVNIIRGNEQDGKMRFNFNHLNNIEIIVTVHPWL
jgi:hypothetical protein